MFNLSSKMHVSYPWLSQRAPTHMPVDGANMRSMLVEFHAVSLEKPQMQTWQDS
jgi:hypothetical protein